MRPILVAGLIASAAFAAGACGDGDGGGDVAAPTTSTTSPTSSTTAPPPFTTVAPTATTTTTATATTTTARRPARRASPGPGPGPVTIAYRLERRTRDEATADFETVAEATLADARGWVQAAFLFERRDDGPYLVVLAEGEEVDRLCLPYDTYGKYSCQNGPVVALNADRWRTATPKWIGDLADYRRMLVNHEVGHLLGMRHPKPQCPRPGEPAPIMNQQSTELDGCLPNPWPLEREIGVAARHDRKLAPEYGE